MKKLLQNTFISVITATVCICTTAGEVQAAPKVTKTNTLQSTSYKGQLTFELKAREAKEYFSKTDGDTFAYDSGSAFIYSTVDISVKELGIHFYDTIVNTPTPLDPLKKGEISKIRLKGDSVYHNRVVKFEDSLCNLSTSLKTSEVMNHDLGVWATVRPEDFNDSLLDLEFRLYEDEVLLSLEVYLKEHLGYIEGNNSVTVTNSASNYDYSSTNYKFKNGSAESNSQYQNMTFTYDFTLKSSAKPYGSFSKKNSKRYEDLLFVASSIIGKKFGFSPKSEQKKTGATPGYIEAYPVENSEYLFGFTKLIVMGLPKSQQVYAVVFDNQCNDVQKAKFAETEFLSGLKSKLGPLALNTTDNNGTRMHFIDLSKTLNIVVSVDEDFNVMLVNKPLHAQVGK